MNKRCVENLTERSLGDRRETGAFRTVDIDPSACIVSKQDYDGDIKINILFNAVTDNASARVNNKNGIGSLLEAVLIQPTAHRASQKRPRF